MKNRPTPQEFQERQFAWTDGRDPQARPPLTVAKINLWDGPGRKKVVGQIRHQKKIRVEQAEYCSAERRWYYRIRHLLKAGWVPAAFLSAERPGVLGDFV